MKVGPIDVGQFLWGTLGVVLALALYGLIVLLAVKLAARWMDRERDRAKERVAQRRRIADLDMQIAMTCAELAALRQANRQP